MTTLFVLQTIFEIAIVVAVIWGAFNEDKLIAFEEKLVSNIRRRKLRLAKKKASNCSFRLREI